jgi:D-alanyl-D-alanine carboxypeptidase (penicillin-binding protein 5/6)
MTSSLYRFALIAFIAVSSLSPVAHANTPAAAAEQASPTIEETNASVQSLAPLPVAVGASHMVLIDFETGTVLAQKNASEQMFPSSMSKLMTLYMVFDELKKGTLTLDATMPVSERAWNMQGSKMFVPLGERVKLEDLIRGIAIQSGNDACVVVAEGLAGSEEAFATRMNEKAKELGLTGSNFMNASGWPDENHYVTAWDLAWLGTAIIRNFPEYYHYFSEKEFTYNGIRQYHRNLLLGDPALGVDGLKTGHTEVAGYGIVLSGKDPSTGRRLILVVNGLPSMDARKQEGEALLSWGYRNFDNVTVVTRDKIVTEAAVWLGKSEKVALKAKDGLVATLPKTGKEGIRMQAKFDAPIAAPIKENQEIGTLEITLPSGETRSVPLVAAQSVDKLGSLARIPRVIGHWLGL